jgi:hypothetical protein
MMFAQFVTVIVKTKIVALRFVHTILGVVSYVKSFIALAAYRNVHDVNMNIVRLALFDIPDLLLAVWIVITVTAAG